MQRERSYIRVIDKAGVAAYVANHRGTAVVGSLKLAHRFHDTDAAREVREWLDSSDTFRDVSICLDAFAEAPRYVQLWRSVVRALKQRPL